MRLFPAAAGVLALLAAPAAAHGLKPALPRLQVSENKRFLVTADGKPFFYLGDTAWELFHRLDRDQADRYLKDRAAKGFTVVQAVVLAELNGLNNPNPYGQKPLDGNDPTKPNEKYFEHVDWVVARANELGPYVGMLPTWGDKWHDKNAIFTPQNAAAYGEWLGRRYKDRGIIWVLGGDRPAETERQREIIRAMAKGLKAGDGGHLMTSTRRAATAPRPGSTPTTGSTSICGRTATPSTSPAGTTRPGPTTTAPRTKPVVDGEPVYEDHPVAFNAKQLGHSVAADVRRPLYWDLFSGACGHTYGHHSVWQMYDTGRPPINNPLMTWAEALDQPGAGQMRHAKALLLSRPYLSRVPDDSIVVPEPAATSVPGAGTRRYAATRDAGGSYALVYAPVGRSFAVAMDKVTGPTVRAWWFNPRDGRATAIGEFANTGSRRFTPPDPGELLDWVLVLDDAAKSYSAPGG